MNEKPIIGITLESKHDPANSRSQGEMSLNWNYAEMIAEAGGLPIIIPPTADPTAISNLIDGWLIPGGLDIDAARFGEENHPKVKLQDGSRFSFESELFKIASPNLPILGICYGCQFLNVIQGGTLEQHIPDRTATQVHSGGTADDAAIEPDTKLERIVGARVKGKSYHHQAVGKVGDGLKVNARHQDGTIEGIESTGSRWLVGVQWHPERTPQDDASKRLFRAFIESAREFRKLKE